MDNSTSEKIANILGVTIDGIKNFSEEGMVNYFNTFNEEVTHTAFKNTQHGCNFNPLDKLMESLEANKHLYGRTSQLASEREKFEPLNVGR